MDEMASPRVAVGCQRNLVPAPSLKSTRITNLRCLGWLMRDRRRAVPKDLAHDAS